MHSRKAGRLVLRSILSLVLVALVSYQGTAAAGPLSADHGIDRSCERTILTRAPGSAILAPACAGVRPGAMVKNKPTDAAGCTFNFLFKGSDGDRYIGTAGHCILSEGGKKKTWRRGGPPAYDAEGKLIGRFVYAALVGRGLDIALIRLRKGVAASPKMCHWGGPTSMYTDRSADPVDLLHFGNGTVLGYESTTNSPGVSPARRAIAMNTKNPDEVVAIGAASFGDSGSGVITAEGGAVGVLVAIGVGGQSEGAHGDVFITRLPPQVKLAQKALKIRLKLVTAGLEAQ